MITTKDSPTTASAPGQSATAGTPSGLGPGTVAPCGPASRSTNSWVEESLWLQANPGEWLLFTERSTLAAARALVWRIRNGGVYAFRPAGHFAAQLFGTEVSACYLGED